MAVKNDLYYEGSTKFHIGHPKIHTYECLGQRGRGKTTYWLQSAADRSIKNILDDGCINPHKFIFLRRSEEQLKKVVQEGLFNAVKTVPKYASVLRGFTHERIYQNKIILANDDDASIEIGYLFDLNNVKGISIEDADTMIFDEIVEPERMKYKGGNGGIDEPELLARLDETVFRRRDNWIILLGNFDSPTNPYNEYFGIPYGAEKWSDRKRGFLYEVDVSAATTEMKERTSTGQRWAGTRYSQYSNGTLALGSVDDGLIMDKPPHAIHEYNANIAGTCVTIWKDPSTMVYYIHDNYKWDRTKPIYTVMSKDMQVNSLFVTYNSEILRLFRIRYGKGMVRFNNQKTATLFNLMISLTK